AGNTDGRLGGGYGAIVVRRCTGREDRVGGAKSGGDKANLLVRGSRERGAHGSSGRIVNHRSEVVRLAIGSQGRAILHERNVERGRSADLQGGGAERRVHWELNLQGTAVEGVDDVGGLGAYGNWDATVPEVVALHEGHASGTQTGLPP